MKKMKSTWGGGTVRLSLAEAVDTAVERYKLRGRRQQIYSRGSSRFGQVGLQWVVQDVPDGSEESYIAVDHTGDVWAFDRRVGWFPTLIKGRHYSPPSKGGGLGDLFEDVHTLQLATERSIR